MSLLEERALVLSVDRERAWLRCERQAGCARCAEGKGCGSGLFSRLLGDRLEAVPIQNTLKARPGDVVLLGLEPAAIENAAWLVYGLPLAGLLSGALAGQAMGPGDLPALLGAAVGVVLGLAVVRYLGRRLAADPRYQAVMLRKLASDEPCPSVPEPGQ